jgi:ribosome-binding protein aMBF1 (putative translation factor)
MASSLYLHVRQRLAAADMVWPDSDGAPIIGFVPEDDFLRRLGAVIRDSRKLRGLSQEELGERVGRDKNSISR